MEKKKGFQSVDEYVKTFPKDVQVILEKIRKTIKDVLPKEADEVISYQMPAYKLNGKNLVFFGAWKSHIGFYATPAGNIAFQKELKPYKQAKGSVQFPFEKPIPYDLIAKIAEYRMKEGPLNYKKK